MESLALMEKAMTMAITMDEGALMNILSII